MEYSKNFNFALPSRDNDVDLADINEISNNFRKIDENSVKKEVGKGLSTNDFTDEYKAKVENALTIENIDQTYSPESENAQSGIAVKGAIKKAQNDVANAIKGTKTGKTIQVDDVSPLEHIVDVKVESKNLCVLTNAITTPTRLSYDESTQTFTVTESGITQYIRTFAEPYPIGAKVAVTLKIKSGQIHGSLSFGGYHIGADGRKEWQGYITVESDTDLTGKIYTATFTSTKTINAIALFVDGSAKVNTPIVFNAQFELGKTATEYTPYIDPSTVTVTEETTGATYTPNADGTCEIVSVSPNMTLSTDTDGVTIDCKYNRDTKLAVYDKIKYRIINDITITEDINVFSTSQDDNGNAFDLQKLFFLFIGKFDAALSNKPLSLSVKKGIQYLMYKNFTVAADKECGFWLSADTFLRTDSLVGIQSEYSNGLLLNFNNGTAQGLKDNNTSVDSDISLVPVVLSSPAAINELRFSVHDQTIKMKKGSRFLLLGIDYNA